MEITSQNLQDDFLTLHRLSVCNLLKFDDYVIKDGFHRLWLSYVNIRSVLYDAGPEQSFVLFSLCTDQFHGTVL